jgi:hypothetical protein
VPRLGSKSGVLNPAGVLPLDWLLCAAERNASLSQRRPRRDPETGAGAHFGFRVPARASERARASLVMARALFGTILSDHSHLGAREWGMFGYPMRRVPRQCPSDDQRKFLELLRDLGPRDNGQTAAVRKATKRACQVRGWVEWRSPDNSPSVRAWHLTIIGRKALNSPARRVDSRAPPRLLIDL